MPTVWAFLLGLFVVGIIGGVVLAGLCMVAADADNSRAEGHGEYLAKHAESRGNETPGRVS